MYIHHKFVSPFLFIALDFKFLAILLEKTKSPHILASLRIVLFSETPNTSVSQEFLELFPVLVLTPRSLVLQLIP